jgi:hypothetical protein
MKTTVLLEEGVSQIVLTPESVLEETLLKSMAPPLSVHTVLFRPFYLCQGGNFMQGVNETECLIIKFDSAKEKENL